MAESVVGTLRQGTTTIADQPNTGSNKSTKLRHSLIKFQFLNTEKGGRIQEVIPSRPWLGVPGVMLEGQVVELRVHVVQHAVLPEELCPAVLAPLLSAAMRHTGEPPTPDHSRRKGKGSWR